MSVPFPQAGPGFDEPLAMLAACHDRIQRHTDLLRKVAERVREARIDDEAREAAAQIIRYFSTAGRKHHADEEEDLFPALRGRDDNLDAVLARLEGEHQEMEQLWQQVAERLEDINGITEPEAFADLTAQFDHLYSGHIALENEQVLPRAETVLDAETLKQIGQAMAHRRGVAFPE